MQRQLNEQSGEAPAASARHGLAAGDGGAPERADWTIDQGWASYRAEEHAVWKTLFERQTRLLPGYACDEFVHGMRALPMSADEIPDFRRLSDALMRHTGWQVVAVPGLVPNDVFFEHLANRRFPAGRFIRRPHELDYLEEPDVFHDVFGHVPMLMNPAIADYIQAYGQGGLRAQRLDRLPNLARVYWYTVEFGLLRQKDGLRIYGAGIASSATETRFAIDDPSPNRIAFDLERVRTHNIIDDFQQTYFVVDDLEQLLELARIDFGPLYARLGSGPEYAPGDVLASDRVIHRGTGAYHAAKRQRAEAQTMNTRVVMVTGAAGNLGRAVAQAFDAAGDTLVLVDRSRDALAAAFGDESERRRFVVANLLAQDEVDAAVRAVLQRHGRIDVLCNLAGGFRMGEAVHETSASTWNFMLDLNARSVVHMAHAVVPAMLAQRGGRIVNVGANAAGRGAAHKGAYIASKAVVARLTEAMADELREHGINVNCVLPGTLDTPENRAAMPDADPKRWVAPGDLAAAIAFLASDAARAVHGASLPVVGLS